MHDVITVCVWCAECLTRVSLNFFSVILLVCECMVESGVIGCSIFYSVLISPSVYKWCVSEQLIHVPVEENFCVLYS